MSEALQLLAEYGYFIVFVWVLLDAGGLPLPSEPALVGAGVLAGSGSLHLVPIVALATIASVVANSLWYAVGRRHGLSVLSLLCKLSFEPQSCISRSHSAIQRNSTIALLASSFVLGLQILMPPMSGAARFPFTTFVDLRTGGSIVWVLLFVIGGVLLADYATIILTRSLPIATFIGLALAAATVLSVAYRFVRRKRPT